MALAQCTTDAFQSNLLDGTYKMALYSSTLSSLTVLYTTLDEVSGSGYTAGGASLIVSDGPTTDDGVTYLSFSDVTWNAALSARAALIYDTSRSNLAVAVFDFEETKTSTTVFTVLFPPATSTSAVLRVKRG